MSRYCKNPKCEEEIPNRIVINGKERNLSSRKYCLSCSPFGQNGSTTVRLLIDKSSKTKICSICNKRKKISAFYKRAGRKNSLHRKCKNCFNELVYDRMMRRKIRAIEYLGGKCNRCGYSDNPAIFDFHHTNPKNKDIGVSRIVYRSWDKIKVELDKCELLCSNCHRIEHSPKWCARHDSNV